MGCGNYDVLGNGALVIVKAKQERHNFTDGKLVEPPRLLVLLYDIEMDSAVVERISFKAAEALAPEKFAAATSMLRQARTAEFIEQQRAQQPVLASGSDQKST